MDDRMSMRRLAESGQNMDGILALLIMMIVIFCAAWAPSCTRRCRRRSDSSHHERSSAIDPRMEAEIEIFRRMMEEAALAIAPREGLTVDARRDYVLNCLMTKHVIACDKDNSETKIATTNERDDVVLDLNKSREDGEDDPATTCAICLSEYEGGDEIAWSHNPNCSHFFHRSCIAEWLLSHEECPCCRFDFLRFDDDDERGDLESGSRVPPRVSSPMGTTDMDVANVDFARSIQLFLEMVASRRSEASENVPRNNENEASRRASAILTALETPANERITLENASDSQEQTPSSSDHDESNVSPETQI